MSKFTYLSHTAAHTCVTPLTPPRAVCPLRPLPNGNIEVGVHIADVTHFLKSDTAMDAEAALRGTTVYLVQVGGVN